MALSGAAREVLAGPGVEDFLASIIVFRATRHQGLELANRLQQKYVARRCAEWIRDKVEIRSIREANLLHGKLQHIDDGKREHTLMGSSNFTRRGLGLSATPNIELNMVVDSDRDRADLKAWFDELWGDATLVAAIVAQFARKNAAKLFTGGGGKLLDATKAAKSNNDFELITWLVIK